MDREGLKLEIELLETRSGNLVRQFNSKRKSKEVLLVIHSPEMKSRLISLIQSAYPLWKIRHAHDALEAYAQLEQKTADIIISEYCMPYISGYGLIKKLDSQISHKHIPIVIVSPEPLEEIIDTRISWLFDPFSVQQLISVLEEVQGN